MATLLVRFEDTDGGRVSATFWFSPPLPVTPEGYVCELSPLTRVQQKGVSMMNALKMAGLPFAVANHAPAALDANLRN